MANDHDFSKMQEEAVRRAREMQSRARFPQNNRGRAPVPEQPKPPAPPPVPPIQPVPEPPPPPKPPENDGTQVLAALFQDKERTVILTLLLLLGSEGNHYELMFALLFLLL